MSINPEQVTFVDIKMEDLTNYLFHKPQKAKAVYIQLKEFEEFCSNIGIKPYFYTPSNTTDETFIRKVTLDSGIVIEVDFMKISYARLSYEPEKEG